MLSKLYNIIKYSHLVAVEMLELKKISLPKKNGMKLPKLKCSCK